MANPFYASGEQRATKVRELFAAIAPRYDLINDVQSGGLHRWWKRRVVGLAGVRPGEEALDLCCGTGDVALALAARGARVTGLDFSAPMLAVAAGRARRRAAGGRAGEVRWVEGDALATPFEDGSFDVITMAYGLRNLASFEGGVAECWRLLRPGGRVLVLDFGKPDNRIWRALYFGYLRVVVPVFGWVFCGNSAAYGYILESLHHYPAQRGVEGWMREAGFRATRVVNVLGGMMSINVGVK